MVTFQQYFVHNVQGFGSHKGIYLCKDVSDLQNI